MSERMLPMTASAGAASSEISLVSSEIFPTEENDMKMIAAMTTSTAPKPASSLARRWFLNQDMKAVGSFGNGLTGRGDWSGHRRKAPEAGGLLDGRQARAASVTAFQPDQPGVSRTT